ncbi:serine protease easter-like isoform X2 [Zophobas morio]|uniref:serine protease easter-like isoform X2 n=1 Tax=Zophobas morio TaxID=2755281 RepID=UPI0030832248
MFLPQTHEHLEPVTVTALVRLPLTLYSSFVLDAYRQNMFLLVFLLFGIVVGATGVTPCKTPDGLNGDCKLANECEPLLKRLSRRPLASSDILYLKNSTCGFVGASPKACCPFGSSTNNKTGPIEPDSFDFAAATSNLLPTTDECGLYNPYRTFGREHPDLYEFPWMVLLEYNTSESRRGFYCGGALISTRYVLTAANCIEVAKKRKWSVVSVRLGEYDIDTDPDCVDYGFGEECADKSIDREVEKVVVHENYKLPGHHDDIALVRLKKEVEFSDFVQPLCLPMTTQELTRSYVGKKLFVAGWTITGIKGPPKIKLKDQRMFCEVNWDCEGHRKSVVRQRRRRANVV